MNIRGHEVSTSMLNDFLVNKYKSGETQRKHMPPGVMRTCPTTFIHIRLLEGDGFKAEVSKHFDPSKGRDFVEAYEVDLKDFMVENE